MGNPSDNLSTGGGNNSSSSSNPLLSIVGAISNPIGSVLNWIFGKDAAEEQNERNIEQWNRENAYNHPKKQIERMLSAGLNPGLMYQNGASGMVSAQSPSMVSAKPNLQGVDPLTAAQIANLNAQTEATRDANARENELQPFNVQNVQANNDVLRQKVKNLTAEEQKTYAEKTFTEVQTVINDENAKAQRELWNAQFRYYGELTLKTNEEWRQLVALYTLREQGIQLTNAEIASRIGVNSAEAMRLNKCLDVMSSEISLNKARENQADVASYSQAVQLPWTTAVLQSQASLQWKQSGYWSEYTIHPFRFNNHGENLLNFGSRKGR